MTPNSTPVILLNQQKWVQKWRDKIHSLFNLIKIYIAALSSTAIVLEFEQLHPRSFPSSKSYRTGRKTGISQLKFTIQ